jgi:C4-type Zn-finger protein
MPMTNEESTTYWHQAYIEAAKKRTELEALSKTHDSYIKTLEGVLKDAREALSRVCNLSFEEDLAKYGSDRTLTQSAQDAINQYTAMTTLCEKALARVTIAVGKAAA